MIGYLITFALGAGIFAAGLNMAFEADGREIRKRDVAHMMIAFGAGAATFSFFGAGQWLLKALNL